MSTCVCTQHCFQIPQHCFQITLYGFKCQPSAWKLSCWLQPQSQTGLQTSWLQQGWMPQCTNLQSSRSPRQSSIPPGLSQCWIWWVYHQPRSLWELWECSDALMFKYPSLLTYVWFKCTTVPYRCWSVCIHVSNFIKFIMCVHNLCTFSMI